MPSSPSESLVSDHYLPLYRLTFALTGDPIASRQAVLRTLALALLETSRHPSPALRFRLYSLVLQAIRPIALTSLRTPPASPLDSALWQVYDGYGPRERRLLLFIYLLGCSPSDSAALLRVSLAAVQAQLSLSRQAFRLALQGLLPPDLPAEGLDAQVTASFDRRWPSPSFTSQDLEDGSSQVLELASEISQARQRSLPFKVLALLSGVILATACGVFAFAILYFNVLSRPPASAKLRPGATAVAPAPQVAPLTRRSSSEAIRQRFLESPSLWRTLWVDVQLVDYGPPSYIGPHRLVHLQAWIAQPGQSLELSGPFGSSPISASLVDHGSGYLDLPSSGQFDLQSLGSLPQDLLHDPWLRSMLFPFSAPWSQPEGSFQYVDSARLAGRRLLVFDWFDSGGLRRSRLWLDSATGLVLRWQEYSPDASQTLLSEAQVVSLALDVNFPQTALFDPSRLSDTVFVASPQDEPSAALAQPSPAPTLSLILSTRPLLTHTSPPAGFDPAGGVLNFQYPGDASQSSFLPTVSLPPVDLFSSGYYLGSLPFASPWSVRCARSPDGQRLAFVALSSDSSPSDFTLRWFNLSDLSRRYEPLAGLDAHEFVFSPDSRSLVVFARGRVGRLSGLYQVDLPTGVSTLLLELFSAHSLVFSPDGQFLAFLALLPDQLGEQLLVLHLRSGQITFQQPYTPLTDLSSSPPVSDWGASFPVDMGGLHACSLPPTSP